MNKIFKLFYTFTMLVMILSVLLLGVLIADKMKWIDLFNVATYLPFENQMSKSVFQVNNELQYIKIDEHRYHNGSNQVVNIKNGIVEEVGKDYVVVLLDDQRKIKYQNLTMVHVLEKERVLKGVILGSYVDSMQMYFYDEKGLGITYEEILQ